MKKKNIEAKNRFSTKEISISAMVIAIYVVAMYFTQSFAFGQYQIRIATSLYSLAYFFPYLILPLGIANCTSNILGGMGIADIIGGCIVGIITSSLTALIGKIKFKGNEFLVFIPILLVPGLGVAIWLSKILNVPYHLMALSLCIGQVIPAIVGVILIRVLKDFVFGKVLNKE